MPRYNQKTHWYELKPLWNRTWLLSPGFVKLFSIRIFLRWTSDYTWKLVSGSRLCLSTLGNFALFILFSPSLSSHFHPNCEIWCVYYTASTDAVLYGRRQVVSLYIFNWQLGWTAPKSLPNNLGSIRTNFWIELFVL